MADGNATGNGTTNHTATEGAGAHTSQRQDQPNGCRSQTSGAMVRIQRQERAVRLSTATNSGLGNSADARETKQSHRTTNGAGSGAIEQHNPQVQLDTEYYRSFVGQLLDVVGSQDDATVSRMIELIRSGASQQDIWTALSQYSAEENGSRNRNRRTSRGGVSGGEENEGRLR